MKREEKNAEEEEKRRQDPLDSQICSIALCQNPILCQTLKVTSEQLHCFLT